MATAMSQTRTTDHRLGFTSLEEETAVDSLPVTGQLPSWLSGALVRVTPAKLEVGERRLDHWFDRHRDAEPLRDRGRARVLQEPLHRQHGLPGRAGGRSGAGAASPPTPCRSLFKRVQSIFSPEPDRQPERQPEPHRRALHRDDRDADADRVRPRDARDGRAARVRGQAQGARDHGPPAPRPRAQRARQLPRVLLAGEQVRALRRARRLAAAPRDRGAAGQGAGLHARVRHERAPPDPHRVPAAGEPAEDGASRASRSSRTTCGGRRRARSSRWSIARPERCAPTRPRPSSASTTSTRSSARAGASWWWT